MLELLIGPLDIGRLPGESGSGTKFADSCWTLFAKAAGELQLEDIKKRINKDVLRQLNMTDEDFQKFLKAYKEMLKKQKDAPKAGEKLADPKRKGGALPNQGARRVQGVQSKDAAQGSGPGTARGFQTDPAADGTQGQR